MSLSEEKEKLGEKLREKLRERCGVRLSRCGVRLRPPVGARPAPGRGVGFRGVSEGCPRAGIHSRRFSRGMGTSTAVALHNRDGTTRNEIDAGKTRQPKKPTSTTRAPRQAPPEHHDKRHPSSARRAPRSADPHHLRGRDLGTRRAVLVKNFMRRELPERSLRPGSLRRPPSQPGVRRPGKLGPSRFCEALFCVPHSVWLCVELL